MFLMKLITYVLFITGDYFKLCKRNDPELGNCIKDSLNQMKPLLRKGKYFTQQLDNHGHNIFLLV